MAGALKVRTSVAPDVWTIIGAGDIVVPSAVKSAGSVGVDTVGPTSGTTSLVFKTITLPIFGIPGRVHVWGTFAYSNTVSGDRFNCAIKLDGVDLMQVRGVTDSGGALTIPSFFPSATFTTTGTTATVITFAVSRISGTGTATLVNNLQSFGFWTFVPDSTGTQVDYGTLDARYVSTTAVRYRVLRAAQSIAVGDVYHSGTGSFPENVGGFTGTGATGNPLIVPSTGTYLVNMFYSGGNFATGNSAAIVDVGGVSYFVAITNGTTNSVGGCVAVYCTVGTGLGFRIRNNHSAAVTVSMDVQVCKVV